MLLREPRVIAVSARTGEGIDKLLDLIQDELPRPDVEVEVLVPYDRGDLVSRIHDRGEVLSSEHVLEGTRISARVSSGLAHVLEPYRQEVTTS